MLQIYAEKYFGIDKAILSSNMLLVSTVPSYYAGIFKVSRNQIIKGFNEFTHLLRLVANIELEC